MRALLFLTLVAGTLGDANTYDDPNTLADRQTMVELFEWKWTDIAEECEDFLQYYGYGAVQVSPAMEHLKQILDKDWPWSIRYEPVSYKLNSRSGTRAEFADMVNRCNKVGVRIVVDTELNHMVRFGLKKDIDVGSSGDSDFDGETETFPGVPYYKEDTNDYRCDHDVQDSDYQNNATNVRNCRDNDLIDLDQGNEYVRQKMIAYMDDLIDLGVAGFRLDHSKYMWPSDLASILSGVKNVRSDVFGANKRPFVVHDVNERAIDAIKSSDYTIIGRYEDFNYGRTITKAAKKEIDFSDLQWFGEGYGYGNLASHDVVGFIDNHESQRATPPDVLNYKSSDRYAMCVGFMLAWTYGYPRVMSGYYFVFGSYGPPNYGPLHGCQTKSPYFNPDKSCAESSGWVCEHRWPAIRGMALFRKSCVDAAVSNVVTDTNRLAFARTGKGFFALNNGNSVWQLTAQTTLPKGSYCDVWSGEVGSGSCKGITVNVGSDGKATFAVPQGQFMAVHVGAKIS